MTGLLILIISLLSLIPLFPSRSDTPITPDESSRSWHADLQFAWQAPFVTDFVYHFIS